MRILILTIGTRGDVQPYVAVAKGLSATGHEAIVCTCIQFESFVVSHGVRFAPINDDMLEFMRSDDGRRAMENSSILWEMIGTARQMLPKLGPMMRRQIRDTWASTQAADPDLILFHPKALCARDFAELLGIPCALAFYLPMYVPTSNFPAMGFPRLPFGGWYHRWTYRLIDFATRCAMNRYVNKWRVQHGLTTRRGRYLTQNDGSPIPALHAHSASVIPRPPDWPDSATVTAAALGRRIRAENGVARAVDFISTWQW